MDSIGIGLIDFNHQNLKVIEATTFGGDIQVRSNPVLYFDLASLTKPLTNSLSYFLRPDAFDEKMKLCLNHKGGLPAWGLLSRDNWKEQILNYPIRESETLYSDFSALRVMLELGKKSINQKSLCSQVWDKETIYWTDLQKDFPTPQYGFRDGSPNFGKVHDPNAWTIGEFCSHAGVFSTIKGLCKTLLSYQTQTGFIQKVKDDLLTHSHRFSFGWDRVINPHDTLAGEGCGPFAFGHLGFTGTSIWINPDLMRGHVILTNATKYSWYDKANLNHLRRVIGKMAWTEDM